MSPRAARPRRRPSRRPPTAGAPVPPRPLSGPVSTARHVALVLRTEWRGLLRDRRALLLGVVLPVLLFPLLFLGQGYLARIAEKGLAQREVRVAADLSALPAEIAAGVRERLDALGPWREEALAAADRAAIEPHVTAQGESEVEAARLQARERLGPGRDALLWAARDPAHPRRWRIVLFSDETSDLGNEARGRLREALREVEDRLVTVRLATLPGGDPAASLAIEPVDVATAEERGGAALGRFLPMLLLLVVVSGGSFAALSAFCGERDAGTLEALLVQPVPASAIASGKLLAVVALGLLSLLANGLGLFVCLLAGLGELPGIEEGAALGAGAGRVLVGLVWFAPAAVLLSALLSLVSARASSFREGQQYVLPVVLVAMLPALLAMQPDVELDPLLAAVPLAGSALAMRDALSGELALLPGAIALLAQSLWAALLARALATRLESERWLAQRAAPEETRRRRAGAVLATRLGFAGAFLIYLVGGFLQVQHVAWGLAATFGLVVLPLAVLGARRLARLDGRTAARAIGLRLARPAHLFGAALLAPPLALGARHLLEWQQSVLPLPVGSSEGALLPPGLGELSTPLLLFLLALLPGVCEELLFRGAVLGGYLREGRALRAILLSSLAFALAHASVHRLLPTFAVGALLASLVLRTRSLWPAIVLHACYNAVLLLSGEHELLARPALAWLALPALLLFLVPPPRRDPARHALP